MAFLDTMGLKRVPGTILPVSDYLDVSSVPGFNMDGLRAIPDNVFILAHVPARYDLSGFKVITVFRDPRNVLVSYIRHRKREDDLDVSIPQALKDFWGAPFVETYASYLGWASRCVRLRFEDLQPDTVGEGRGIYPKGKDWNTRTGSPSHWEDWWDEEAQIAFIAHGGLELLKESGYG